MKGFQIFVIALAACNPEVGPAFDIEFFQDPNVNTVEQVLEGVEEIVLVVDSDQGLYDADDAWNQGGVEVRDTDFDEPLELVSTISVNGDRFPLVRLVQGGLPSGPLAIRVFGGAQGEAETSPFAQGGLSGLTFGSGIELLQVPFNINSEFLPPRVSDVRPENGAVLAECSLETVFVLFSRAIDVSTLSEPDAVIVVPGGAPIEIIADASGLIAHLLIAPIEGEEALSFLLTVSTSVRDLEGNQLDQVPSQSGPQPFESEISVRCLPSG